MSMKKMSLFLGIIGAFVGATSCKKDWTCTCTDSANVYSWPIENVKKKDAQATCDQLTDIYVGTNVTCSLE
jgi:hypothetical protein